MELARLTGAVDRWCIGDLAAEPDDVRMTALLAISRDPAVWGAVLGTALVHAERGSDGYQRVAEVARAAGADEQLAATHRAWLLAQRGL